jgi:hypothetical protein
MSGTWPAKFDLIGCASKNEWILLNKTGIEFIFQKSKKLISFEIDTVTKD